ncbi:hypothetical protein RYX36_002069, partial [Vicia faba]
VRCQSESGEAVETTESDIGIVGDDAQDFYSVGTFSSAPGIDMISVFPKNITNLVTAGDDIELLVGVKNDVSKFLQPGSFDLVGIIIYEIDEHPYKSTFFNGTIEVVKF